MVCASDRSKVVFLVLFLFCVTLWYLLQGVSCRALPCSLLSDDVFFLILFSIMNISLGEEEAGLCASRAVVCLFCTHLILPFFSSSWYKGLAAVCACGTPWTYVILFEL